MLFVFRRSSDEPLCDQKWSFSGLDSRTMAGEIQTNKGSAFRLPPCVIIQQPEWKTSPSLHCRQMTHIHRKKKQPSFMQSILSFSLRTFQTTLSFFSLSIVPLCVSPKPFPFFLLFMNTFSELNTLNSLVNLQLPNTRWRLKYTNLSPIFPCLVSFPPLPFIHSSNGMWLSITNTQIQA